MVAKELTRLPEGYYSLNDIVFKTNNGTTQIDHIVVSKYGVFTIETKNYSGDIYGNDFREEWTQIIVSSYVTKNYLYNPVKQSRGHAAHIKRILDNSNIRVPVIPIVVFTGSANISNVETKQHVVHVEQLLEVINLYRTECLNETQVANAYEILQQNNIREQVNDLEHVNNVYNSLNEKEAIVASGHCPYCGGRLQRRTGRYGLFYGCSNYPKCRFTKPIR